MRCKKLVCCRASVMSSSSGYSQHAHSHATNTTSSQRSQLTSPLSRDEPHYARNRYTTTVYYYVCQVNGVKLAGILFLLLSVHLYALSPIGLYGRTADKCIRLVPEKLRIFRTDNILLETSFYWLSNASQVQDRSEG